MSMPVEIKWDLARAFREQDTRRLVDEFLHFRRNLRGEDGREVRTRQVLLGAMAVIAEEIGTCNHLHDQPATQAFVCSAIAEILIKTLGNFRRESADTGRLLKALEDALNARTGDAQ